MITLQNVTKEFITYKKYPGFKGAIKGLFTKEKVIKTAVDDMSFHIGAGEMVGYIGSNGAGKSTTIKMMTGILVPTQGSCIVDGVVPYENRQKNAQNIGVVFGQRTQLWWDLPLSETYSILKKIYSVSEIDFKQRMELLNEVLDLPEFMNSTVRTLSLGQRMRADLGAALLHNPKVLFLDEPTIGLDVVVKEKICNAIKQINKEYNTTVILTTHDLGDIEELCNRMIIIDHGKKVYDGGIREIKDTYGYMRTVEIEVKDAKKAKRIDLRHLVNLAEGEVESWVEDRNLYIRYNRNKIAFADIATHILPQIQMVDIKIKDTEIEEIVKRIYVQGEVQSEVDSCVG